MSLTKGKFQPLYFSNGAAASVTGTLVETTLATFIIPGGAMGPNGVLVIDSLWSYTNSANAKTLKITFGGTAFWNIGPTTTSGNRKMLFIYNRNSQSSQIGYRSAGTGSTGGNTGNGTTAAIDSSANVTVNLTGTLANTGETIQLEYYYAYIAKSYTN